MRAMRLNADTFLVQGAIAVGGIGLVATFVGGITSSIPTATMGAALAAAALLIVLAAGWFDPLDLVLLTLPLPAVLASSSLRVAAVAPITALALAGWFLHLTAKRRTVELAALPFRSIGFVIAALMTATLLAQSRGSAMRELFNLGLLLGFLVMATDLLSQHPARMSRVVRTLAIIAGVCGAFAVLEAVGLVPNAFPRWGTRYQRAALGFGQPNALGMFLALSVPFAVYSCQKAGASLERWLRRFVLAAVILGLAATFSRGSWLSVLFGSLVLLATKSAWFTVRIWFYAALSALLFEVVSGGMLTDTVTRTLSDWVIEQRFSLMWAGVLMFLAYPWFGVGPGGYAEMLDEFGAQVPSLWDYLPTPHNAFVQMAAEAGAIGLLAFVVFWIVLVRSAVGLARSTDSVVDVELQRAIVWAVAIAVCSCMVMWPFSHGTGQAIMLVIALLAASQRRVAA
jgi:O-antigen ligase